VDGQQSKGEESEGNGRKEVKHVEIGKGDLRERGYMLYISSI